MNDVLKSALQSGKVAGAYIIEGVSAEAVMAQADEFLMSLYCREKNACGECSGCLKYKKRNHADLLVVDTAAKSLKVEDVRGIAPFVYRKSFEGGWKTVLLPRADTMTEQAQNALLKVLEEPPEDTVFLLGTVSVKYLLPTILSRCIILRAPKSADNAAERLIDEFSLPTVKARVLMRAAEGDYFLAASYAAADYFTVRADMMLMLGRLFSSRSMATSATEKLILKHEAAMEQALRIALVYLRDTLAYKYTGDAEGVANFDILTEIQKHAQEPDIMLVNTMEIISRFLRECEICAGLNKKLVLTGMLFDILRVRLASI